MSKHVKVDGKLLQVNKRFSNLKMKQQEKISAWMYEAYKRQAEQGLSDDEALILQSILIYRKICCYA